jgi:hypothetical protein
MRGDEGQNIKVGEQKTMTLSDIRIARQQDNF